MSGTEQDRLNSGNSLQYEWIDSYEGSSYAGGCELCALGRWPLAGSGLAPWSCQNRDTTSPSKWQRPRCLINPLIAPLSPQCDSYPSIYPAYRPIKTSSARIHHIRKLPCAPKLPFSVGPNPGSSDVATTMYECLVNTHSGASDRSY